MVRGAYFTPRFLPEGNELHIFPTDFHGVGDAVGNELAGVADGGKYTGLVGVGFHDPTLDDGDTFASFHWQIPFQSLFRTINVLFPSRLKPSYNNRLEP